MARAEENREDLLREAESLIERIELSLSGQTESVIAGFRREGALSFFFGPDPVYQFNSAKELRRAYVGGLLYKAEAGRLASLDRRRSASEVMLVRHDLSDAEQFAFLNAAGDRLGSLRDALDRDAYHVVGQIPAEADIIGRLTAWLDALGSPIRVADSPRVM